MFAYVLIAGRAEPHLHRLRTKSLKTDDDEDEEEASKQDKESNSSDGRCSVPGCDSRGHLSGKFESHCTQSTCPVYHNLTPEDCQERYKERSARREERNHMDVSNKRELRTKTSTPSKEKKINALLETRRKEMQNIVNSSPKNREKLSKQKSSRYKYVKINAKFMPF